MKHRRQYPGASPYTDRHGRRRWRYRKGGFSVELGTEYGSEDFRRRYEAAVEGHRVRGQVGAGRTIHGSLSDLIASYYRSPEWQGLAYLTKKTYRGIIEGLRERHGDKPVRLMERRHVMNLMAEKADTPAAANNLRKRLMQLMDHAIALDWRKDNPAKLVKPYRLDGGGYHTWDEAEIARFFEVHEPGSMAHRAVTLMLYTGAARVDAVKMGWANVKGDRIEYRRQKTIKSNGILVSIPIHPDLSGVLAACPRDAFTFLETAQGAGRSADGLGNLMREWCDAAGLSACSSHGLRKACARRLAEAGASAHEIMSVTGHKTLAEVQRYTEAAMREGLADSAHAKLLSRPNREQTVVNLVERFAKKSRNHLKDNGK